MPNSEQLELPGLVHEVTRKRIDVANRLTSLIEWLEHEKGIYIDATGMSRDLYAPLESRELREYLQIGFVEARDSDERARRAVTGAEDRLDAVSRHRAENSLLVFSPRWWRERAAAAETLIEARLEAEPWRRKMEAFDAEWKTPQMWTKVRHMIERDRELHRQAVVQFEQIERPHYQQLCARARTALDMIHQFEELHIDWSPAAADLEYTNFLDDEEAFLNAIESEVNRVTAQPVSSQEAAGHERAAAVVVVDAPVENSAVSDKGDANNADCASDNEVPRRMRPRI